MFEVLWQKNADDEQKAAVTRGKSKSAETAGSVDRKRRRKGGRDQKTNKGNKGSTNPQTDCVSGGRVSSGRESGQAGSRSGAGDAAARNKTFKKAKSQQHQSTNQKHVVK